MKFIKHLANNKGSHHLIITIVIFVLTIIGGWYVMHSQKEGRLKENLSMAFNEIKAAIDSVLTKDRK